MGRIIDTRDPDTYMSLSEYARCIEEAIKANEEKKRLFQDEMNEKLKEYNIQIKFHTLDINDRTYTDIYLVQEDKQTKLGCCFDCNGDDIKKVTKKALQDHFNRLFK